MGPVAVGDGERKGDGSSSCSSGIMLADQHPLAVAVPASDSEEETDEEEEEATDVGQRGSQVEH